MTFGTTNPKKSAIWRIVCLERRTAPRALRTVWLLTRRGVETFLVNKLPVACPAPNTIFEHRRTCSFGTTVSFFSLQVDLRFDCRLQLHRCLHVRSRSAKLRAFHFTPHRLFVSPRRCMLFLKTNDPFHFGHLTRAMFNVLRIETKDSWDQVRGGRPLCAAAFD